MRSAERAQRALQALMNSLGMSQIEVGQILGVAAETIDLWGQHPAEIPVHCRSEIEATEAGLRKLQALFRPELLLNVVRQPTELFAGECALAWILRGRIAEVAERYEAALLYQA